MHSKLQTINKTTQISIFCSVITVTTSKERVWDRELTSTKMKKTVMFAAFVAVLIMLFRTTAGHPEKAWLEEMKANAANKKLR